MEGSVRLHIDLPALSVYLSEHVPEILQPFKVDQFSFGQSNPTYKLTSADGRAYVLRKKPPGKLAAKSLHDVEREYEILKALQQTDVPVPNVYHLCRDARVIGTSFYLMEFLDGRIFKEAYLPTVSSKERQAMWKDTVKTLAKLHKVDYRKIGLERLARPVGYYPRQLFTFAAITEAQTNVRHPTTKQKVGPVPHMDDLISFFSDSDRHPEERTALIHGDFKIDNLVFHKTEPRVIGILDWEQSTVGHPLSDLVFLMTGQLLSPQFINLSGTVLEKDQMVYHKGLIPDVPDANAIISWYATHLGWDPRSEVPWALAFSLLRTSVICQGIKARKMHGQSSSDGMADYYISSMGLFSTAAKNVTEEIRRANSPRKEGFETIGRARL